MQKRMSAESGFGCRTLWGKQVLDEEMGKRKRVVKVDTPSSSSSLTTNFGDMSRPGTLGSGCMALQTLQPAVDFSPSTGLYNSPPPPPPLLLRQDDFLPTVPSFGESCIFTSATKNEKNLPTPHLLKIALQNVKFEAKERMKSFSSWTTTSGGKRAFARAGFIYPGLNDETVCFFSNCRFDRWLSTDCPWVVHGRGKPNCPFVQMAAPANVQMMIEDVCDKIPNLEDPSYFRVRLDSLDCFDSMMSKDVKMSFAAAGFMCKDFLSMFCFACGSQYVGDLTGNLRCPLAIHNELNKDCDFLKMICLL